MGRDIRLAPIVGGKAICLICYRQKKENCGIFMKLYKYPFVHTFHIAFIFVYML